MSDLAIRVQNLSKQYHIGEAKPRYKTLRESLISTAKSIVPTNLKSSNQVPETTIWALKDVSFEINQGDVVGIIGRNGAGKSTLLKVLAHITNPTKGRVEIHGRVGSLLEVGTGFHPELTGRENIYLNGAILGMKKTEIDGKFDEIVDFAEIEKFLDTPAKHYSSGMYMRLAFAVAAHLEPEILLVDEVLAVGDAAFQKKCLGKMGEVAKQGRTVLFVSHNMQAIRVLCQSAILLRSGCMSTSGYVNDVISNYLDETSAGFSESLDTKVQQLPHDPSFRLKKVNLSQNNQPVVYRVLNGEPLEIELHFQVLEKTTGLRIFFDICDNEDTLLFRSFHDEMSEGIPVLLKGDYISKAIIPPDLLAPIQYIIHISAGIYNLRMCIPYPGIQIPIMVEATGNYNRAYLGDTFRGKLAIVIPWNLQEEN